MRIIQYVEPNLVFYCSLSAFFLDSVINQWVKAPFFTCYLVLLTPFLLGSIYKKSGRLPNIIVFFLVSLCLSSLVHLYKYGIYLKNLSDTLYLSVFAISFVFYDLHSVKLKIKALRVFTVVLSIMFMYSFVEIDKNWIADKDKQVQVLDLLDPDKASTSSSYTIGAGIEKNRQYNSGLFKVAHVGAFLFGICLIGYWFLPLHQSKPVLFLLSAILLFFIVWSGTRIFFAALLPGLIIFIFRKKRFMYLVGGALLLLVGIYFRQEIYEATRHTPLGSVSGVLIAVIDDWQNLSRIAIWKVWWVEVSSFSWLDMLFGKGYAQSFKATGAVFEKAIWFHNDSLSIIFSYGLVTFLLYILVLADWIKKLLPDLKKNAGLLVLFVTLISASLMNGLYFYQPLFFFYILFLIRDIPHRNSMYNSIEYNPVYDK